MKYLLPFLLLWCLPQHFVFASGKSTNATNFQESVLSEYLLPEGNFIRLIPYPDEVNKPIRYQTFCHYPDSLNTVVLTGLHYGYNFITNTWSRNSYKPATDDGLVLKGNLDTNSISGICSTYTVTKGDKTAFIAITVVDTISKTQRSWGTYRYHLLQSRPTGDGIWFSLDCGIGWYNIGTHMLSIYPCELVSSNIFLKGDSLVAATQNGILLIAPQQTETFIPLIRYLHWQRKILSLSQSNDGEIISRMKRYCLFWNVDQFYRNRLRSYQSEYFVMKWLSTRDPAELDAVKSYFIKMNKDDYCAQVYLYTIISSYTLIGKPDSALKYFSLFQTIYPNSFLRSSLHSETIKKLNNASMQLKQLDSLPIEPDNRLWQMGNIFFELSKNDFNEGEVCWNMDNSFGYYKQIIEKYPKSSYADDAEFIMLSYYETASHEGGDNGYNLEAITKYNALLEKYPESNLRPEMLLKIALLYYWLTDPDYQQSVSENPVSNAQYIQKAKQYFGKVLLLYPNTPSALEAKKYLAIIKHP